jgi:hypothetical protein
VRLAFTITGTVRADTIGEACRTLARWMREDPADDEWAESDECEIGALRFEWNELAEAAA